MDFLATVAREAATVPTEFHEVGTWTPAGGSGQQVAGIFNQVSEVTDIGAYLEADGVSAQYNMASSDITPRLGDGLLVRGYDYRIVGIEPTGRGRTVLVLGL